MHDLLLRGGRTGSFEHVDVSNEVITAQTRLFSKGMVIGGK